MRRFGLVLYLQEFVIISDSLLVLLVFKRQINTINGTCC